MARYTTVGAVLSVAHEDHRRGDGTMHGHTFEVWAKFCASGKRRDARDLQTSLTQVLAAWDHKTVAGLDGEDLAMIIAQRLLAMGLPCRRVVLERRAERIMAEWEA